MTNFQDLFEYNAWANALVLASTDQLSDAELRAPMDELGGSARSSCWGTQLKSKQASLGS